MIVGYSFQFDCIGGDYTLQSIVRVLPWWIFFLFSENRISLHHYLFMGQAKIWFGPCLVSCVKNFATP
jgi:hypothetical protein